jgi:hypothetical protein
MNFLKNELTAQARNPKLLLGRGWLWVERQKNLVSMPQNVGPNHNYMVLSLSLTGVPTDGSEGTGGCGNSGAAQREAATLGAVGGSGVDRDRGEILQPTKAENRELSGCSAPFTALVLAVRWLDRDSRQPARKSFKHPSPQCPPHILHSLCVNCCDTQSGDP